MYETWFRFTRRPFSTAPQLSDYYPASVIESAAQTISRCIQRGAGPALIIGPPGTGKTVLCMKLHASFCTRVPAVNLCCSGLADRRSFLQSLLFEFGRPYRRLDDGELRLSLVDYLTSRESTQSGAVIFLDDAQHLPLEALDEVRMLSNLVRNAQWCANIVLAGDAGLEELLSIPQMESFQQRVAARAYLEAFRRDETVGYLGQCLARANSRLERIFADDAVHRIHDHSRGIPRLVNQLCDHALILGAIGHHQRLDAAVIDEAWNDLQQLPSPDWQTAATPAHNVLEFGTLNDPAWETPPDDDASDDRLVDIEDGTLEHPAMPAHRTSLEAFPSLADDSQATDIQDGQLNECDDFDPSPSEYDALDEGTDIADVPGFADSSEVVQEAETFDTAIDSDAPQLPIAPPHFAVVNSANVIEASDADPFDAADESLLEAVADRGAMELVDDPDGTLTAIEARLEALRQEFAGESDDAMEPESTAAELPEPAPCENPFIEEFESEVLVIDRCGTLCHSFLKRQPVVRLAESAELVHALQPVVQSPERETAVPEMASTIPVVKPATRRFHNLFATLRSR